MSKLVKAIALIDAGTPAKKNLIQPIIGKDGKRDPEVFPEWDRRNYYIIKGKEYLVTEHLADGKFFKKVEK